MANLLLLQWKCRWIGCEKTLNDLLLKSGRKPKFCQEHKMEVVRATQRTAYHDRIRKEKLERFYEGNS